jgi:hypothetical protein
LDGEALTDILPTGYLDEVAEAAERVSSALKDKALAHEESKGSTANQNALLREAKVWPRGEQSTYLK